MSGPGNTDHYVAGRRTAQDWHNFKTKLINTNDAPWDEAFEEYFKTRLDLRYLQPIKVIQENGSFQGEGFSIVAIQCTLIEFLAAITEGSNYRFVRNGDPPLGQHEYNRSSDLFVRFLSTKPPFSAVFSRGIALDFYASIRCGLLHEATTKNGWKIWASGSEIIDAGRKIVWRNNLQAAIDDYITQYGLNLLTDPDLQAGFIRKFDYLAAG